MSSHRLFSWKTTKLDSNVYAMLQIALRPLKMLQVNPDVFKIA